MATALEREESITTRVGDKLKARVAFVTGGTRGIGAAICRSLASQGATLAAGYSRQRDARRAVPRRARRDYRTPVSIHQGNVGHPRRTAGAPIAEVIEHHGRLDILVNNAGITLDKTVLQHDRRGLVQGPPVNLSGAFFLSPGRAAAHGRARHRPDRQRLVRDRRDRQHRPGQLRGVEVRPVRPDQDAGARGGLPAARPASSPTDGIGLTVNTVTPGFVATEMLDARAAEGAGEDPRPDPGRPARPARGDRAGRALPRRATRPPTSPARSGGSTAAWTCSCMRARRAARRSSSRSASISPRSSARTRRGCSASASGAISRAPPAGAAPRTGGARPTSRSRSPASSSCSRSPGGSSAGRAGGAASSPRRRSRPGSSRSTPSTWSRSRRDS